MDKSHILLCGTVPIQNSTGVSSINAEKGAFSHWDLNTGVRLSSSNKEFCPPMIASNTSQTTAFLSPTDLCCVHRYFFSLTFNSVNIYNILKEKPICRFHGHKYTSICCSPDNRFVAAGDEYGNLFIWEIFSGLMTCKLEGIHLQCIDFIRFNFDGSLLATSSKDGSVKVWQFYQIIQFEDGIYSPKYILSDQSCQVAGLEFGFGLDNSCKIYIASFDGNIRIYDMIDGNILLTVSFPSPISVFSICSTENTLAAGCNDGNIYLHEFGYIEESLISYTNVTSKNRILKSHISKPSSICLSPCGKMLISGDYDGNICVWSLKNDSLIRKFFVKDSTVIFLSVISKNSLDPCIKTADLLYQPLKKEVTPNKSSLVLPISKCEFQNENSSIDSFRRTYSDLVNFVFEKLE